MGDMKNPGRGVPLASGEGQDPFADLADMFEAEFAADQQHGYAPAARSPVAVGRASAAPAQDFDTAFDAAFGDEFAEAPQRSAHQAAPARPDPADAYQSWIVPRGARPAPVAAPRSGAAAPTATQGRSSYAARPLNADLETAIQGLSAPANPRDTIVVETQSFAPERVVDDYRHAPAQPELDDFDELIASELAVMNEPMRSAAHANPAFYQQQADAQSSYEAGDPSGAFDEGYYAEEAPAPKRSSFRRTAVTLGGGALSLVLLGAVGLFVWNGGSADAGLQASNEPLLIKADTEPFKTVPKDPGGRTVPNQNKAVYNRVNGAESQSSTTQQALLTDAEEPMDLPVEEEPAAYENLPGVDPVGAQSGEPDASQARLDVADAEGLSGAEGATAPDESPVPVLQPRKVRTMVVRPDGTLVAAEAEAPAAAPASEPAAPTRLAAAEPAPVATPVREIAPAQSEPAVGVPTQVADPMEVAAIPAPAAPEAVAPAPMPTGSYFVQISSQPSEAAAQQSMRSLGARFSSVISGRPLGIQSAEIPGKGTFYRVRVAASSKDEASDICGKLKAAGGNCFVAR